MKLITRQWKLKLMLRALASFLVVMGLTLLAHAQSGRTYVSADKGSDVKKCTSDQPCRTFNKALAEVAAGGEVVALDSGDYDPFTINRSATVEAAPGVHAGITVKASAALSVGARIDAGPSDVIVLRGLTFNGLAGDFGVMFKAGKTLHVENCVIHGFSSAGVISNGFGELLIKDTTVRNNTGTGILINPGPAVNLFAKAAIDHCRLEKNGNGLYVSGNVQAVIRDSLAVANGTGINTVLASGGEGPNQATVADLTVENCLVSHNATGILAFGAIIRVSNSTITGNDFALVLGPASAALLSRGNNTVEGNGAAEVFSGAFTAK